MPSSSSTLLTSVGIAGGNPARKPVAMTLALAVALATGLFPAHPVKANPEMAAQNAETRFAAMDGNKDGKVGSEEFFAAHPQMKEGAFAAIDADGDGLLSLEEWKGFAIGHGKGGMDGKAHSPKTHDTASGSNAAGGASGQPPSLIMPSGDPK